MRSLITIPAHVSALALVLWCAALPVLAAGVNAPTGGSATLENPLKFQSLEKFVEGVLQTVVMVALPIIVAFMVYAGFLFITARGKSSQISDAKKNFVYVIAGTIMVLSAWVLATLIGGTVTQILRG